MLRRFTGGADGYDPQGSRKLPDAGRVRPPARLP
jgi:hypothetical protein